MLWLALLLVFSASAASATLVHGWVDGRVLGGPSSQDPRGALSFGLPADPIPDTPFRIDFAYDTDLWPEDLSPFIPDDVDSSTRWLDMSITINGETLEIDPNRLAAVISPGRDGRRDSIDLAAERNISPGNFQRYRVVQFAFFVPNGWLQGTRLHAPDRVTVFSDALGGLGVLRIADWDGDIFTEPVENRRQLDFFLQLDRVTIVPEPGTAVLLGLGLVGLSGRGRKLRARSPSGVGRPRQS